MTYKKTTSPRPFTGYLNFSPDIVSSDFAEPRARQLRENEKVTSQGSGGYIPPNKTGQQNTKILRGASKAPSRFSKYKLEKTQERKVEDALQKRIQANKIKEAYRKKAEAYNEKYGTNISTKYSVTKKKRIKE